MKNLILLIAAYCITPPAQANVLQAVVNNGNWTTSSTWSTNTVPTNGDVAVIPAGINVVISSNIDDKNKTITVLDYGTLTFTGGNSQLNLGPLSQVVVYPNASIVNGSGQGSHIINIGSNQVFQGNQGNITGPQYATVSTPGFQSFNPLPVKFEGFSLTPLSDEVKIEWITAEELAVDHFEVERSLDGSHWGGIATVNPTSNCGHQTAYVFADRNILNSKLFYRIKEVDRSGAATYTSIKSVSIETKQTDSIEVSPQGQGRIMLKFNQPVNGGIVIRFISLAGQVVKQEYLGSSPGNLIVSSSLRGNYIVSIANGKDIQIARQMIL